MDSLDDGIDPVKLGQFSDRLYHWPGRIDYIHCPGWTAARVAGLTEKIASRRQVDAVIVDYFQKFAYDAGNRLGLTSAQARGQQAEIMKVLAETLGVPILLLSQLNRDGKVRDTGELEEKANVVIQIKRPCLDGDENGARYSPVAAVQVQKNTFGACFDTQMFINGERYQWTDVERKE